MPVSNFPAISSIPGMSAVCIDLVTALPHCVYPEGHPTFQQSKDSYWSLNACEVKPACFVKPTRVDDVATAIKVLKSHFDTSNGTASLTKFAVRSGGHAPEAGFASAEGSIVIDMSLFNEVVVVEDRQTALIGAGARWLDVSRELDSKGLAVVGGRNSNVGVGGLVLGGGISFFSPRFGMVCDNIDEYEIVLADGTIASITASAHHDLWRALKGGAGNFGIVTRIKARTFTNSKIWAGYAYWTGGQAPKVLKAFAEFNKAENFDEYAAGPILALGYVQRFGLRATASSLVYTKPIKWAPAFDGFNSIWRLWSTNKVQTLTDATRELDKMAPPGQRQFGITTTVLNDLDTFLALNDIYMQKLKKVKGVKGSVWSLIFQPLSAVVRQKSNSNVLGLGDKQADQALIIIMISVSWVNAKDDELVNRISREIISASEEVALSKGTAHPFRYLNYAASGQDPFSSYGTANNLFLQEMSKKYDPNGFFRQANQGGFKLALS